MRDNLLTHTSGKFGNAWRPLDGHDWRAYYCHLMTNNAAEGPTMGTAAPTIKAYLAYGVCILSLRNPSLGLNLWFVLLLGICWWISAILQTSRKYVAIFTCVEIDSRLNSASPGFVCNQNLELFGDRVGNYVKMEMGRDWGAAVPSQGRHGTCKS